ncbi:hypothetical protein J4V93_25385, partial [Escherichia coli]
FLVNSMCYSAVRTRVVAKTKSSVCVRAECVEKAVRELAATEPLIDAGTGRGGLKVKPVA